MYAEFKNVLRALGELAESVAINGHWCVMLEFYDKSKIRYIYRGKES